MKKFILIALFTPALSLAQDTPKPATDDCPSWNKKSKSNSKAEYFYFLRTNKAKDPQTISQSNYPGISRSREVTRPVSADDPFNVPKMRRTQTRPTKQQDQKSPETITSLDNTVEKSKTPEEQAPEIPEIKVTAPVAENIRAVEKTKEVIAPKETEKVEVLSKEMNVESTGLKAEAKAAGEKTTTKEKTKKEKKTKTISTAGKTVKTRKRNASKCPDF